MSQRILVVDDEANIVTLVREGLESEGFAVDSAANATEALALVREQLYDAAILDFALPDVNGLQLHREIRAMDPDLARNTLFISGRSQNEDDLSYYLSAASGFLAKPFDLGDLLSAVRELLDG